MKKAVKITLIAVAVLLVLFVTAGFVIGNYFFKLALDPHSDKSSVLGADHNEIPRPPGSDESYRISREWFENSGYFEEYIESYDGLALHAYTIEQPEATHKWAILCHGYTGRGDQMASSAMHFYEDMGFNLLLPDARGHGESEGDYIGMGWHDRLDIVKWIELLLEKDPDCEIALYGVSMGGATVMMVSGEELPSNVKVIVEDCGYISAWGEFSYQLKALFGLPAFPIMHFSSIVTQMRAGYWLGEASALEQVKKSTTPMLFIHGTDDTFVPFSMLQQVYDAANVEKEMLAIPGAGHGQAATMEPERYWKTVQEFVERFIR